MIEIIPAQENMNDFLMLVREYTEDLSTLRNIMIILRKTQFLCSWLCNDTAAPENAGRSGGGLIMKVVPFEEITIGSSASGKSPLIKSSSRLSGKISFSGWK